MPGMVLGGERVVEVEVDHLRKPGQLDEREHAHGRPYQPSSRHSRRPTYQTIGQRWMDLQHRRECEAACSSAPVNGTMARSATTMAWTLPFMSCWPHAPTSSATGRRPVGPDTR